mgnify:CR=1 FL=1
MKNLKSQLNKKLQFHLDCIAELSATYQCEYSPTILRLDSIHGLSRADHILAANILRDVLTQIKINEHYDSVNSKRQSNWMDSYPDYDGCR